MMAASLRSTAPQARDVSPWIRIIIGAVLFIAAAIFMLALRHPQTGPTLKDLSNHGDQWWTRETRPSSVATPRVQPVIVQSRPIIIQTPPKAQPTPPICQICLERAMRYQRAIETGMGAASSAVNTRQLAQIFAPSAQATPEPLIIRER